MGMRHREKTPSTGIGAALLLAGSLAAGMAVAAHLERIEGTVQFASLDNGYIVVDGIRYELTEDAYVVDARGNPAAWTRVRPGILVSLIPGSDGVMEIMLADPEGAR